MADPFQEAALKNATHKDPFQKAAELQAQQPTALPVLTIPDTTESYIDTTTYATVEERSLQSQILDIAGIVLTVLAITMCVILLMRKFKLKTKIQESIQDLKQEDTVVNIFTKKDRINIVVSTFILLLALAVIITGYPIASIPLLFILLVYWGYRFIKNDISFLKIKN